MAKRNRKSKSINIQYLPEDVLCQIFSHHDQCDLKLTSLVCKLFCSLSSPLVHELTLKDSSLTCSDLKRLFKRFPRATKICLEFPYKLDKALLSICNSNLNLEKLQLPMLSVNVQYPEPQTIVKLSSSSVIKSIKSLQLYRFHLRTKLQQVFQFINLFPSLTELNIINGHRLNDILIHKVTSNFPNLRKINLSCNRFLTDKTLDILSSNCPKLDAVNFSMCKRFTPKGLYKFLCNNPQLSSVHMPDFDSPSNPKMVNCMHVLRTLNHLSLEYKIIQDDVLIALAESQPLLKSLVILFPWSRRYTMTGLSRLLSTCSDLESLKVDLPDVKNCNTHDAEMSIVVKRLPNLQHITIWSHVVCQATLFSLVNNCPLLETVSLMRDSKVRAKQVCDQGMERPAKKNYSIKSIDVHPKSDTWLLSTVKPYCPNLRK